MDQDLTIKQILAVMIRKRWVVLVCALAVALLLGGYQAWSTMQDPMYSDLEATQEAEAARGSYERKHDALVGTIAYLEKQRDETTDYISTSPLMQVDPYHKGIARLSLSVEIGEEALGMTAGEQSTTGSADEMCSRIVGRYYVLACAMPLAEVAGDANTAAYDESGLNELLVISMPTEETLQITATAVEGVDGEAFLDAIYSYLAEQTESVADALGSHTLKTIDRSKASVVDDSLAVWQQEYAATLSTISEHIQQRQLELETLEALGPGSLPTPVSIPTRAAKYALLGFVVGLILGAMVVFVQESMSGRVRSADQLRYGLKLRYFGNLRLSRKGSKGKLDALAARLDGSDDLQPMDERTEMTGSSIKAAADGKKSLLLVGTLPAEVLAAGAKTLNDALSGTGICVQIGGDVNRSSGVIEKLSDADGVLLAERIRQSRCDDIAREVDRLKELDAELFGFVLV